MEALLGAASGLFLDWRPDWPISLPPDLFTVDGDASRIAVSFEAPKSSFGASSAPPADAAPEFIPGPVAAEWRNGLLARFPVFQGQGFMQGVAEYSGGSLVKIRGEGDSDIEAEILEYDDEGLPQTVRVRAGADYYFVAMAYLGDRVEETWYDADGKPLEFISADASGQGVRISYSPQAAAAPASGTGSASGTAAASTTAAVAEVRGVYFDSFGRISAIVKGGQTYSGRYNKDGMPAYQAVSAGQPASAQAADRAASSAAEHYSFQWDNSGSAGGKNRLVRLRGQAAAGAVDYRYEYVLDGRGNWTQRREIRMVNLQGRLFAIPGAVIRRQITYGPGR
jgi:hypothetical protein